MKKPKLLRLILVILAITLAGTAVLSASAARFIGDINGDSKVSVFDAQMIAEQSAGVRTLTSEQTAAAGNSTIDSLLQQIWGLVTAPGDSDGDGYYELSTLDDLLYMAINPGMAYELTGNIDLKGVQWTPVKQFTGTLNGNGYAISNFTVSQSVDDIAKTDGKYDQNMGFFGGIEKTGVITDLHLRDVTINATEDAGYIGILAGTNRGSVSGVTVTGTINDDRTDLNGGKIYIGAVAGKIASSSVGTITCGTSLSVTDDLGKQTTSGLCANVRMHVQKTSENVVMGLVGWHPAAKTVTGQWCDSANDSAQLSQALQSRQQVVVDYMDAMATVAWQVCEPITYNAREGGSVVQSFEPGVTYYGLPYTSMNGSLERFMSQIDTSSGTNITVSGLESSNYHEDGDIKGYDDFAQYMGNDCSAAVGWAWLRVSPIRVDGDTDTEYAGGVWPRYAMNMVPNAEAQALGIYPVGDWTTVSDTNDSVVGTFAYEVEDGVYDTLAVYETIGKNALIEAYAVSRKADAIVYLKYDNTTDSGGGHARLLAADPIVIRNANGSIDTDASYVLCTEQGDGLGDRKNTNSSWRYHYKYTFEELISPSTHKVFLPVTIRALRSDYVKVAYVNQYSDLPVTGPATGKLYSNFRVISSTVTVSDAKGNVIYDNEIFTGVSNSMSVARDRHQIIDLSEIHGDAFAAAAEAAGMTVGRRYYYSVELLLSNGETKTIKDIKKDYFTYEG